VCRIVKILGLITARGGSKGIPRKNLRLLCGRPLLAYTCEAALAARLDRVLLSTDDVEIRNVGLAAGVEAPFLRPAELATAEARSYNVVEHAVGWLAAQDWYSDIVVLLQPTSPLRQADDIDRTVNALLRSGADASVTVVRVPHNYSPFSLMQSREDGTLENWWTGPVAFDHLHRQAHPALFARNGPAVLAVRTEAMRREAELYCKRIVGVEMQPLDSIDIDEEHDLILAEALLMRRSNSVSQ
jgi:CMP-N,N'-diacetyllegionaminic acid synthase